MERLNPVLVVDDDPGVVHSTVLVLEALGVPAVGLSDVQSVLSLMRETRPVAVLHDFQMPGIAWEAHIAAIRADPAVGRTPIIMCSGALGAREAAARLGLDGFLEKPFSVDALLHEVSLRPL